MNGFICPVCGGALKHKNNSLCCNNKHNFDIAKEGYVNLYIPKKGSKNHGDDKLMVRSRRDFLNKGYYNPLLLQVTQAAVSRANPQDVILDAGCGECYYTSAVENALQKAGKMCSVLGVDISKNALAAGAKRNGNLNLAVASVFHIPVIKNSCNIIISVFAPFCGEEFMRVIKKGNYLIMAVPLEEHLWGLKKAIYDKPYKNEVKSWEIDGFRLDALHEIKENIHLNCQEDIWNLFTMTPYYYKTGAGDQEKLLKLSQLDTQIEFAVAVYKKL